MRRFLVCLPLLFLSRNAFAQDGPPCSVDKVVGISEEDARGVEELVCSEVRSSLPREGVYHVRVVRIGTKIALALTSSIAPPKQLVLSSLDEVPVAAPRLVTATADGKVVGETQDVTNIVGMEARVPKKKAGEIHAWLGMVGVATVGSTFDTGAGAHFGMSVGSETWSFAADLRVAGGALTNVALAGGVRYHFGTSDVTPFLGIGTALVHIKPKEIDDGNSGLAFYSEVGLDVLRTSRVGGAITMRLDLPTFALEEKRYGSYPTYETTTSRTYAPVLVTGLTMRF